MAVRFSELVVDATDPRSLARWWAEVLGWEITEEDDDAVEIADAGGALPTIVFVPVPEAKSVKDRIHIDVSPVRATSDGDDPPDREVQDEELARLLGLGASRVDVGQGDVRWVVLADPEGNEFCLLRGPLEPAPPAPPGGAARSSSSPGCSRPSPRRAARV